MSDPFLGQLSLVGFNFAPTGWAFAAGQTLPISTYSALFSLLGTMYGGNGTNNFQLPNLQGNVALGVGQTTGLSLYNQGETGGAQSVTLIPQSTPNHTHPLLTGGRGSLPTPGNNALADARNQFYTNTTSPVAPMSPSAVSTYGTSGPHNNMMPYLALNWIIALSGIYPARQ